MTNSKSIKEKIDKSANFYSNYLNIDYMLYQYSFEKLKPFFKGSFELEVGQAVGALTKLLKNEFQIV